MCRIWGWILNLVDKDTRVMGLKKWEAKEELPQSPMESSP